MDFQTISKASNNSVNLVKMQKELLYSVLRTSRREEECDSCVWKVLIFDTFSKNMLSTILKVGNLRELNITLHLHLLSQGEKREKLHGVKAYYLIQPTTQNMQALMDDFTKDLYDQVYINFVTPASDELLRTLAEHIGNLNAVYKIKKIVQNCFGFVTLSPDLFTLNIANAYGSMHSQNASRNEIISESAIGLFSLFRTVKQIPIILYKSEDNSNFLLAQELAKIFHLYYLNTKDFEDEQSDFISQNKSHPVLILTDRDSDLGSQLLHPLHLAAMIHDIYRIDSNKITFIEPTSTTASSASNISNNSQEQQKQSSQNIAEGRIFDLDSSAEDSYWVQKMNEPFIQVASDIGDRLAKWELDFKLLAGKKEDAQQMVAAMNSIHDMQEKKKLIEMYMKVSGGIMHELKSRQLDKYYEAGIAIIRDKQLRPQEKKDLLSLFEDSTIPATPKTDLDKLRVLLIYLLFVNEIDVGEFQKLSTSAGITNKKYLQILEKFKAKRIPNYQVAAANATVVAAEEEINDRIGGIFGKIASKIKSQGKGLLSGMKNYLPGQEDLDFELGQNFKQLVESKLQSFDKLGYKFFDILNQGNSSSPPPKNFSEVIVFASDGANLNEYQNLQEVAKKLGKPFIYGGSEILNAESFISQLTS